jgi:hypothetical protein
MTAPSAKPRLRPDDLPYLAELLELLRQASPPFGQTAERREQWKRRKDEVLNQR